MTWNYRIILHDLTDQQWFGLHEVYYESDRVTAWTDEPITFCCEPDEGSAGITASLDQALEDCLRLPVLSERALEAAVHGKGPAIPAPPRRLQ